MINSWSSSLNFDSREEKRKSEGGDRALRLDNALRVPDREGDKKKDLFPESVEGVAKLNSVLLNPGGNVMQHWNDKEFQESLNFFKRQVLTYFGDKVFRQVYAIICEQEATYSSQVQKLHNLIQVQKKIVLEAKTAGGTVSFASHHSHPSNEARPQMHNAPKSELLPSLKLMDRVEQIPVPAASTQSIPDQPGFTQSKSNPPKNNFSVCKFTWHH